MNSNLKSQNILLISLHRKLLLNIYEKYIERPLPTKIFKKMDNNKTILRRKDIRMWGIINTEENYQIWKNIKKNDIVMFLQNKKFFSKAKVITTVHNKKGNAVDNDVAFVEKHGLLIFLENAISIDLDYNASMPVLIEPHMPNAYFFPILQISDKKKHLLISVFGNLDNAIEFLANPEQKNSSISAYLMEKNILEEIPYGIKTRLNKQRIGQEKFRKNVLMNFSNVCATCGISDRLLLEAAHIIPIKDNALAGKTNNGICLCSNCHKLFDNGLISFNEDYKIIFSRHKKISNDIVTMLKNHKMKKFKIPPSQNYLRLHRAKYGIKD